MVALFLGVALFALQVWRKYVFSSPCSRLNAGTHLPVRDASRHPSGLGCLQAHSAVEPDYSRVELGVCGRCAGETLGRGQSIEHVRWLKDTAMCMRNVGLGLDEVKSMFYEYKDICES